MEKIFSRIFFIDTWL